MNNENLTKNKNYTSRNKELKLKSMKALYEVKFSAHKQLKIFSIYEKIFIDIILLLSDYFVDDHIHSNKIIQNNSIKEKYTKLIDDEEYIDKFLVKANYLEVIYNHLSNLLKELNNKKFNNNIKDNSKINTITKLYEELRKNNNKLEKIEQKINIYITTII